MATKGDQINDGELTAYSHTSVHLRAAIQKVRKAEDNGNSRNPQQVALGCSVNSRWHHRSEFLTGRDEIIAFLTRKWANQLEYRLIKELWAFQENRIAVRFAYESHN